MNAFRRNGIDRQPAPPGPRANRKRGRSGDDLPPEPGDAGLRRGSKDDQIEAFADLLGTVPDRVVAKKAGVSLRTVAAYRARQNIQGYTGPRKRVEKGRRSRIDPFEDLVGTVADRVIAEKAGVSVNAVRNWRRVRGVAAIGRGRPRADAATPTAEPVSVPVAPSNGAYVRRSVGSYGAATAWRVTLDDGLVGVVVGTSLVDAATRAESAGRIASLERIGPVLA